ncbi:hypothetical protein L484_012689 [Morus notabilis]|uniref:Uncharacterized protein n=1 Tax=Morus notabilis TaxID=981085 RepID=W9RT73_9ROSA|nr:hypothetical protein L484_012689 [Morus notabilis]
MIWPPNWTLRAELTNEASAHGFGRSDECGGRDHGHANIRHLPIFEPEPDDVAVVAAMAVLATVTPQTEMEAWRVSFVPFDPIGFDPFRSGCPGRVLTGNDPTIPWFLQRRRISPVFAGLHDGLKFRIKFANPILGYAIFMPKL